ncbi:MAG: hypothetical protein ACR2FO_07990 [Actinomycetota bacterium]
MKQLRIREPWADLAYGSGDTVLEDLVTRIQMLEARVRELEEAPEVQTVPASPGPIHESITIGGRSAMAVGA